MPIPRGDGPACPIKNDKRKKASGNPLDAAKRAGNCAGISRFFELAFENGFVARRVRVGLCDG